MSRGGPSGDSPDLCRAFDWMSDFDKAVEQGMGFRVTPDAEEAQRVRQNFRPGSDFVREHGSSAALVEELIDNHQFSPKGFSIVPQGTPTNNTELDGTGYSDNDPYDDLAFLTALDPPAFDPMTPTRKRA